MPIFHFHDADGVRNVDVTGTDLPDEAAARREAVQFAGEMLRGKPEKLWQEKQWRVEVTDDNDVLLFTIITLAVDAPRPVKPLPSKAENDRGTDSRCYPDRSSV